MTDFSDRYGPWALVAGASIGIGRAYSHEAARRGLDVVMIARGEERLREIAAEVSGEHGVETRAVVADLATPEIGTRLAEATEDLEIGLFVYNAAIAMHGYFLESQGVASGIRDYDRAVAILIAAMESGRLRRTP